MAYISTIKSKNVKRFFDGKYTFWYTLHSTKIVTFNEVEIILNTGNWFTKSIQSVMNSIAIKEGLNFEVKNNATLCIFNNKMYDLDKQIILCR